MSKITINISGDKTQITGSASLKDMTAMGTAFVRCMIEVTQETTGASYKEACDTVLSTIRPQPVISRETNPTESGIYIEE
jgi:hypothetical protein